MSWQEKEKVTLRKEFVTQAKEGVNFSELCRRYEISRKTGYKWLKRNELSAGDLRDRSRSPQTSPNRIPEKLIEQIINLREQYPYWGARKLQTILKRTGSESIPAKSTIHKILKKYGYIEKEKATNNHFIRFEHEAPNHLWQMDFKGHFPFEKGRCHPLTILDDNSRFSLCLEACLNERGETIKPLLIKTFERYGMPERINVDNGAPWGSLVGGAKYTTFSLWLIRLGVKVSYSRPFHPQTNGKDERFHRTLKLEVINPNYFKNIEQIQIHFNKWRDVYNLERPHEGINMQVPAERYRPSYRTYPTMTPPIEYPLDFSIRKVDCRGRVSVEGRKVFVGMAFAQEPIGIRPTSNAEFIEIYYCHQKLGKVNLSLIDKGTMTNLYSGIQLFC